MLTAGEIVDGKYIIISVLGRGGMSTVYLSRHMTLGKERAIKEICREDCSCYEWLRQRLIREANILKELDHPNLPEIIDIIVKKDSLLIIMEYIPGHTLKELLDKYGRIDESTVIEWGRQLCEVLLYLHTRTPPVIYRDLKPSNVIIKPDGKIVLIDFGTAREYRETDEEDTICLGTRGYAAPEQYGGDQSDERTDIYCMGATLYHLLTGRSPEQPPYQICPIRRWDPGFSPALEEFILTCTRPNPAERYQNCQEAGYAIEHLEESTKIYRRKEKKKICFFLCLAAGMAISGFLSLFCRNIIRDIIRDAIVVYVRQAERASDSDIRAENYIEALEISPANSMIYESLLKQYVKVNDFTVKEAAELMNILEMAGKGGGGTPVLEILRQKNPETYGAFCYHIGIGYFFYMNTIEGKKAAQVWFEDAARKLSGGIEEAQRKRAYLYARICSYYNTFLTSGEDRSGEQQEPGYVDFFNTLSSLNDITLRESSSSSQAAAAYMVSVEVAVELAGFAVQFQKEGRISSERIQKELDKIYVIREETGEEADWGERNEKQTEESKAADGSEKNYFGRIDILEKFRAKEEIDNLKNLVIDAGRKNALAAMALKQGGG